MDAQAVIQDVKPLAGQLLPVKTVQETQSPEEFGIVMLAKEQERKPTAH